MPGKEPRDQVLILLPTATSKLQAHAVAGSLQGTETHRRSELSGGTPKPKEEAEGVPCELLRKWQCQLFLHKMSVTTEKISLHGRKKKEGHQLLSSSERRELGELLDKFNGIIQTHPGQTELTEHQIEDQRYNYHHIGSPKRTERKCDRRSRTCWKMGS